MRRASPWPWLLFAGPCLVLGLTDCGEQCDPGYHLERHLCFVDLPAGGDAGGAGNDGEAGAAGACSETTFAKECHDDADCVCDSDFCAGYPGQIGFCTRTGCDADPSVCPSGYSCMDLSSFGAGLPAICTQP
jgi:hypothetical protein